jgi:hypothetical protein
MLRMKNMRKIHLLLLSAFVLATGMVGSRAYSQSGNIVIVEGDITATTTWTSDNIYVLRGAVFVREPAKLRIKPGTLIVGETATIGTLIIDQGAMIEARGEAKRPIVFTSDQCPGPPTRPDCSEFDDRYRGDWGGLIINGRAPINVPGGIAFGEGDTGEYGGNDPDDDSGTLRYVRVEYAGKEFSPDNELNGIAFQGVGSGTEVDYIQVHMNQDDGVEFFGGTVNVKHVLLTNIADDSMDYTDGWTGQAQYVIAQQRADDADQGFEFDNNGENNDLLPRSNPTIYNATLIGDPFDTYGGESDHGMLLREGTAGNIRNSIVYRFKEVGIRLDHTATIIQATQGSLVVGNTIVFGNDPNFDDDAAPFVNVQWPDIYEIDPMLWNPLDHWNPDFRPLLGSPALDGTVPVEPPPAGNDFIEETTFIGAMGPMPEDDWTKFPENWTTTDQGFLGGIVPPGAGGSGGGSTTPGTGNPVHPGNPGEIGDPGNPGAGGSGGPGEVGPGGGH